MGYEATEAVRFCGSRHEPCYPRPHPHPQAVLGSDAQGRSFVVRAGCWCCCLRCQRHQVPACPPVLPSPPQTFCYDNLPWNQAENENGTSEAAAGEGASAVAVQFECT